jgi:hypothetical protein
VWPAGLSSLASVGSRHELACDRGICGASGFDLWCTLKFGSYCGARSAIGVLWAAVPVLRPESQPKLGSHQRRGLRHEAGGGGNWF